MVIPRRCRPALAGNGVVGSHGAPLGDAEIALTREALGWAHAPFVVPQDIYEEHLERDGEAEHVVSGDGS